MVNLVIAAIAQRINGSPTYAWIITEDHLADGPDDQGSVGVSGPSEAPDDLTDQLRHGLATGDWPAKVWTFRLYDDDGELCGTGRLTTVEDDPETDETGPAGALVAPLYDYGEGGWGCTRITWVGHPDWDVS